MHKVPFVSQRMDALPHVTCGVAATMMLLKFHFRRKRVPSYRDLRKALGVDAPPSARHRHSIALGVDPHDVTRCFRQRAIRYRATHQNTRTTRMILKQRLRRAPAMVGMGHNVRRWRNDGHWVVVIEMTAQIVTYLDPGFLPTHRRPSRMGFTDFRRQWDGSSIQIVGFK